MTNDSDRRTYDILRLLSEYEPIGSVRLTEHLRERGYSLTERTVRLTLSNLDESGLTEKAGGRGRQLTPAGRNELDRGDVSGRVKRIRERLSELTSHVTYDPRTNSGTLIVGTVAVEPEDREHAMDLIDSVHRSPLGPTPISIESVERNGNELLEIALPSSVTIDGVLLEQGIGADLTTSGVIEYQTDPESVPYDDPEPAIHGGAVRRFTDVIGEERATIDVVSLLIEAGRTDLESALNGEVGLLVADNVEFPLAHYDAVTELSVETRDRLGGVLDVRRPREPGPFPWGEPGWTFGSLTHAGSAECVIARFVEAGIAVDWTTLARIQSHSDLSSFRTES